MLEKYDHFARAVVAGFQLYLLGALSIGLAALGTELTRALVKEFVGSPHIAVWMILFSGLSCYILGAFREGVVMIARQEPLEKQS